MEIRPVRHLAGAGKAHLEAMGEGSTQTQVSPSTEPARRWRWRKQLGRIVIAFNVSPHLTDKLVRLGWLDAAARAGKEADRHSGGRKSDLVVKTKQNILNARGLGDERSLADGTANGEVGRLRPFVPARSDGPGDRMVAVSGNTRWQTR